MKEYFRKIKGNLEFRLIFEENSGMPPSSEIIPYKKMSKILRKLKATLPIDWVRKMNNIRNRATEIVNMELIFV